MAACETVLSWTSWGHMKVSHNNITVNEHVSGVTAAIWRLNCNAWTSLLGVLPLPFITGSYLKFPLSTSIVQQTVSDVLPQHTHKQTDGEMAKEKLTLFSPNCSERKSTVSAPWGGELQVQRLFELFEGSGVFLCAAVSEVWVFSLRVNKWILNINCHRGRRSATARGPLLIRKLATS